MALNLPAKSRLSWACPSAINYKAGMDPAVCDFVFVMCATSDAVRLLNEVTKKMAEPGDVLFDSGLESIPEFADFTVC